MPNLAKYRLLIFFGILTFVISATFFAIKFAQGYRIDLTTKSLKPSGLLVATSIPQGAQVLINGQLKTATDNTLILSPGEYEVEIKKEGFFTWKKKLLIEKELVTQAEAFLFPQVPDLKPLTFHEAQNPRFSPDSTKVVYSVPLPNPEAGLWVMELTDFPFNIGREPRQIVKSQTGRDFNQADCSWSPDSKQILVEFKGNGEKFLLDPSQMNSSASLVDIAKSLNQVVAGWVKEEEIRETAKLRRVPEKMQAILRQNALGLEFSPDVSKLFYLATASAEIPEQLIPPPLATSAQKETRKIEPGKVYVYDLKEDKNFLLPFETSLPTPTPTQKLLPKKSKLPTPTPSPISNFRFQISNLNWFPTSEHLYWLKDDQVFACEYDGTNLTAIYAGPFIKPFVFAPAGGSKLVVLTQLDADPSAKPNLYSIPLR